MDNHLTLAPNAEEPQSVPIVYVPSAHLPGDINASGDEQTASNHPITASPIAPPRVHRIKIMQWQPPALFVEATPAAARDLQELAGIKQVEPRPDASEPDHCGSAYYTAIVSLLFDARTIFTSVEALNQRDAVSESFEVCEI